MKNIALIALLAIGFSSTTAFAQDTKKVAKTHKEHKGGKHHEKKDTKTETPAQ
jgi:hypothetical protein